MTTKTAILQAIRHKCLDCCVHQPAEIRECPVSTCGLWPFRFGMDPDPSQTRGFAKSLVYTGGSGQGVAVSDRGSHSVTRTLPQRADPDACAPGGPRVQAKAPLSQNRPQEASFEESAAILAVVSGATFADVRAQPAMEGQANG